MSIISKLTEANEFDPAFSGIWFNRLYLIRRIIAQGIRENAPMLSGRILDYGCGSKPYERLFPNQEYIGIDVKESGHPSERKRADFFFDGSTLPFRDSEFDSVLISEVVEHLFDLNSSLLEINRVIRPGGKILITCPFVWSLHEEPYDFARYTPFALRAELEKAGFKIISYQQLGKPIEVLCQLFLTDVFGKFLPNIPKISKVLDIIGSGSITSIARLLAKLDKTSSGLYLSNIVLAQKQ
jgi:SAM-dependent methyltransferase